jgi:hypothetical protein
VLVCTQIALGARAASMPWSRAIEMTASVSVTIVKTIAARRAAAAAVSATSAPSPARSRVASGSRFQTIVGMPARRALVAIPCSDGSVVSGDLQRQIELRSFPRAEVDEQRVYHIALAGPEGLVRCPPHVGHDRGLRLNQPHVRGQSLAR